MTHQSGHQSRLSKVVIDAGDPEHARELAFWRAAIGRELGPTRFPHVRGVRLPGTGFELLVQHLGEGAPRMHLDVHTDDLAAEVGRLESLGAERVRMVEGRHIMRDPAGLLFCVIYREPGWFDGEDPPPPDLAPGRAGAGDDGRGEHPVGAHHSRISKIVIDVPDHAHDRELGFWQAVTGQAFVHAPRMAEFHLAELPRHDVGLILQRLREGPARVHLDLHTDDLGAEVTRLERLGARRVPGERRPWVIMVDPAGLVFCVVPERPGRLGPANARRWD